MAESPFKWTKIEEDKHGGERRAKTKKEGGGWKYRYKSLADAEAALQHHKERYAEICYEAAKAQTISARDKLWDAANHHSHVASGIKHLLAQTQTEE